MRFGKSLACSALEPYLVPSDPMVAASIRIGARPSDGEQCGSGAQLRGLDLTGQKVLAGQVEPGTTATAASVVVLAPTSFTVVTDEYPRARSGGRWMRMRVHTWRS